MTIAIIEPVGGHGGMDYYDYGLAYGLGSNGINVIYYTCDETHIRNFENVKTNLIFKNLWNGSQIVKGIKYLRGYIKALKEIKKKKITIAHLHFFTFRQIDYLILKIAKFMNITIVGTVHDISSFDEKANTKIENMCYKLIDGIIVHNESSYNDLIRKKIKRKKIKIIAHGNYKPFIEDIKLENQSNKIFTLLFFGQIKKVKGLDILINALKLIKNQGYNVKLIIAGKAWKNDLNYYIDLIESLDIKKEIEINFRYILDHEVSVFYSQADLVVLPYTEIYQSGVLLLTMSYGKPVLTSDLEAFKEIIKDNHTGFTFENKNYRSLANKIIQIMNNPKQLEKVVVNSNSLITSKYDWKSIGMETKKFYQSL